LTRRLLLATLFPYTTRFRSLSCHLDDLPAHLRSAVGLLKAHEIPIDWAQLLSDILGWHWDTRAVQREWARAFWGQSAAQAGAPRSEEHTSELQSREHLLCRL